ncbi:MAG: branched-chain amino acid ABC transporter permease [Haloarculaceae archaeon]
MSGSAESRNLLAALWDHDTTKVIALLVAIYAVYLGVGMALGFEIRGQLNSIATLTFYIGVFGLLALALNLHWGYTGLFNIGIVGFMAIGIYTMAVVSKPAAETASQVGGFGAPLWVGMLAGTVVAALFGLVVALPALRLRADYLAIVTIAFSEIVRFALLSRTFQEFQLADRTIGLGGGSGLLLPFDPLQSLLGVTRLGPVHEAIVAVFEPVIGGNADAVVNSLLYGVILLAFVAIYYVTLQRLGHSPFGRVLKAIREDEDATKALGKSTNVFKTKAFMLGCALMGLGGVLWYMQSGAITPNTFRPRLTFFVWIALIIGGAGSNTGSVMGGAIFAAVLFQGPRYFQNLVGSLVEIDAPSGFGGAMAPIFESLDIVPFLFYVVDSVRQLQPVFMGLVLIWLMHNRPNGMLGHRKDEAASISLSRSPGQGDAAGATAADGGHPAESEGVSDE